MLNHEQTISLLDTLVEGLSRQDSDGYSQRVPVQFLQATLDLITDVWGDAHADAFDNCFYNDDNDLVVLLRKRRTEMHDLVAKLRIMEV